MTAWSYSSIKLFDQCPKKFYHLKVAKDVMDEAGPEADYGTKVHEAAELYVKDGTPIPEQFAYMRPIVEPIAAAPGTKFTEMKLGVTKTDAGFAPCGFFDKNVWYRGIVDVAVVNGRKVHYGPIDPVLSRELFIRGALVNGDYDSRAPFFLASATCLPSSKR